MTYAELPEAVRTIVDRRAAELIARDGGELEAVREALAARVTTTTHAPNSGTGH